MGPIRVSFDPTLTRLAASLGDESARMALPASEQASLEDGFVLFMSCADLEWPRDFGPPTIWPYTLEAAQRMAIAVHREFLADWHAAFSRPNVPNCVPADFAQWITDLVTGWVVNPASYSWKEHDELYDWIHDDVCLDGYLGTVHPDTPRIIQSFCFSASYLIEVEDCREWTFKPEYNPGGRYEARTNTAVGCFLDDLETEYRIREAIRRELCPWCLGTSDPLV